MDWEEDQPSKTAQDWKESGDYKEIEGGGFQVVDDWKDPPVEEWEQGEPSKTAQDWKESGDYKEVEGGGFQVVDDWK